MHIRFFASWSCIRIRPDHPRPFRLLSENQNKKHTLNSVLSLHPSTCSRPIVPTTASCCLYRHTSPSQEWISMATLSSLLLSLSRLSFTWNHVLFCAPRFSILLFVCFVLLLFSVSALVSVFPFPFSLVDLIIVFIVLSYCPQPLAGLAVFSLNFF